MIVDGGYLAWTYGPEISMHQAWTTGGRRAFSRTAGAMICLDDRTNWRASVFPAYKQDRRIRAARDPERQLKAQRVRQFVEHHLKPDPSLNTLLFEGCEADDLVAMSILLAPGKVVFGVDKDLLQVPKLFFLTDKTNRLITVETYAKRGPKTIAKKVVSPRDVLLDLCLRGDASDSIPPVLPKKGRFPLALEIWNHPKPFLYAREIFGREFERNLQIAVLPGPHCLQTMPKRKDLVSLVESGEYWSLPLREEYEFSLKEALEDEGRAV